MSRTISSEEAFVFLGIRKGLLEEPLPPHVFVCRKLSEVKELVRNALRRVTWVSFDGSFTERLLEMVVRLRPNAGRSDLITLTPPRPESIPTLLGLFDPVFGLVRDFRWLPNDELAQVLLRQDAADRFIGGSADLTSKVVTLVRGNRKALLVPSSFFSPSGDGVKPDFAKLGFSDFGHTLVLGEYEASTDAVLYELDEEYRRKLNRQRRQSDRSFGASLLRLRKQRGLTRGDFSPLSAKEIARIERNEIARPHAKTLSVIAEKLGVTPEAIESY